jgi:F0F1-type ATP synthase assembly protein I
MIRAIAVLLTIAGMAGLILGVLGIFGQNYLTINPWALAILGLIFFSAGVGLLKRPST